MKKIAISIGDINGIGPEIALKYHEKLIQYANPIYFIHKELIIKIANLLKFNMHADFLNHCMEFDANNININPCEIRKDSGEYSFKSFHSAMQYALNNSCPLVTLPIHKKAWELSGLIYKGHTDYLSHYFNKKAIMMLGCNKMFVALFTDHIPLNHVALMIKKDNLFNFLINLFNSSKHIINFNKALVLGLNPHAGDAGVIGDEDDIINEAINAANAELKQEVYEGPASPDTAFSPLSRARFNVFVSMYHDQGLIPIKALYFYESINVTLGLPIFRTSVDHGVAFDRAYKHHHDVSLRSYEEACKIANNCTLSAP